MELHADERARARRRRRGPRSSRSPPASRPRTSARTSTPRRPARPPPSRCAGRAPSRRRTARPGDEAEPGDAAVLLALVERELEAEADAERRPSRRDALAQRVVEPALAQPRHRRAGRADAGEHREIRVEHVGGRVGRDDVRAEPRGTRARRSARCRRRSRRSRRSQDRPSSTGRARRPAGRAARSARPTALNAASATWCGSLAGRLDVDRRAGRCRRGSASTCFARPGSCCELDLGRAAAAEIDRGARERVVHRHDRVAVARDPARGRRARGRAPRRARCAASSAVWCVAGLEVAAPLEHEVEAARGTRAARGSGRRGPAPVATRTRPAPSSPSRTRMRVSAVARTWRTLRPVRRRRAPASAARSRSSSSRSRTVMRIASS